MPPSISLAETPPPATPDAPRASRRTPAGKTSQRFTVLPGFGLSLFWIFPATLLTAAFFVFVVGKGIRAQFKPVQSGAETMLGQTVPALSRIDSAGGRVFIEGENWTAVSDTPVETGQPVEIIGREGLTLKVKPKTN